MRNFKPTFFLLLMLSLFFVQPLQAQYITIPDSNFAAWLHTTVYDSCMVGNQLDTTCAKGKIIHETDVLNLSNKGINDLTGLEHIWWCDVINNNCISHSRKINLSKNNFNRFPVQLIPHLYFLTIDLSNNNIDTFIFTQDHNQLFSLDLSHNGMKWFDQSSGIFTAKFLDLSYNLLDTIPGFYYASWWAYRLNIRGNKLKYFPKGSFNSINCGNNKISSLAGASLTKIGLLIIDSNLFSGNLDMSGVASDGKLLSHFDCSHNMITGISNMGFNMYTLSLTGAFICHNNDLQDLPTLPKDIKILDVHNNPNLQCLPFLPNGPTLNLNFSNTAIQCLPHLNPNTIYTAVPLINSVPTCDIYSNIHGCPITNSFSGQLYFDADTNCIVDTFEPAISSLKTILKQNGIIKQQVYSNLHGNYFFIEDSLGNFHIELDTLNYPISVICPDSTYYSVSFDSVNVYKQDLNFALKCKGFDLSVNGNTGGFFIPGTTTGINFFIGDLANKFNLNCAYGISGQVQINYSGPITFTAMKTGALPSPIISGNTLIFNVADFGSIDFNSAFGMYFWTDTFAQINDPVCFDFEILPSSPDNNPSNNIYTYCDIARAAYDPNDKRVSPYGYIDTTQEWLTYTIRFQNTGTASATHVVIEDTLDQNLDFSSFDLLNFSHQNATQISEDGIVKFNFPFIHLPDSNSNEPESHGYIQYKIKLKPNLPLGTSISNTAYIYFDWNPPIVTNTVSNTIYYCTPMESNLAESICDGDSYFFNGQSLDVAGIYSATFYDLNGCDSIVNLSLNLKTVDTSITQSSATLTTTETSATYQWLDCDNNFSPITNATGQSFTATSNGNFAVSITKDGCSATSACKTVTGIGVEENHFTRSVKIFPNPTSGEITIDFAAVQPSAEIEVRNLVGQVVQKVQVENQREVQISLDGAQGLYFIIIRNQQKEQVVMKVVKE